MKYIYIQPIGEVGKKLLNYLVTGLEEVYGHPCRIAPPFRVPEFSYSADRDQYNAEVIVEEIMEKMPIDAEKLLCVVDVDLFVPGLNFVFGLAAGNAALISLARLRPEHYGEKKNECLFRERALKEAIASFIAGLDPNIPYSLLAFYPQYYMNDLPTTSKKEAIECMEAAKKYLKRVRIGNIQLLS